MNVDQVERVFTAIKNTGRARAASSVAKETGVPVAEVERLIAFIKSSPWFKFELTKTGLLSKLLITIEAKGTYGHIYGTYGDEIFYKNGAVVEKFRDGDYKRTAEVDARLRAEAAAVGAPYYGHCESRIAALAPFLADALSAMPAVAA